MTTRPTAQPAAVRPPAQTPAAPLWAWLLLCGVLVAAMGYLRLGLFPDRMVPLTYGLPLLVCLWNRDLRLLYGMATAFSLMACYKLIRHPGGAAAGDLWYDWLATGMMLVNIWTVAGVVHALIVALGRVERKNEELGRANAELEASNNELVARDEEITRQNEELQAQTQELEQQADELRQQTEEMEHQGAELQQLNDELGRRDRGLQTLLDSARWLRSDLAERDVTGAICQAAVEMMDQGVCAAAVLYEDEGGLRIRGQWGFGVHGTLQREIEFRRTFASLVVEKGQPAYLRDVQTRPDLETPHPLAGAPFRSILAAPVWADGRVIAAVEVYARRPRDWSEDEFRIVEWLAAQTALALQTIGYQRELELKRREAEEASVQKTRFLAAVSHDVRTPANAISLTADLIERTAGRTGAQAELPAMARDLKASARSLVELVSDVLDLARLEAGKIDLQPTTFPLAATIEAELRQFRPLATSKNLRLTASLPESRLCLHTDKMKLSRVLGNLVGNAIKFTEAGEVQVRCEPGPGGGVRIAVADTGVGIAAADLPRIFDEFHQLRNPERDHSKGTGLGLAICRRLADGLGCDLSVESTPGRGTTFTITLPANLVAGPDRSEPGRAPAGASGGTDAQAVDPERLDILSGLRVLLVEDHDVTRTTAAQLLAAHGAVVFQAPTGRAALHILGHERPDVMLLDLMLPDMDGADVLRQVGRDNAPPPACILAVSGDVREERAEEVRRLGAHGLVPKPLNIDILLDRLAGFDVVRRRPGPERAAQSLLEQLNVQGVTDM